MLIEEVVWAVSSCLTEVDLRITLNRRSKWLNELLNEYGHIVWIIEVLPCMFMIDLYESFYIWLMKLYKNSMKSIFKLIFPFSHDFFHGHHT